jgi:hypothetical protein
MSEIEERVIVKIRERAEVGEKKYNTTMERGDLTIVEWLTHLQEELMDACVYTEKLIALLDKTEDAETKRLIEACVPQSLHNALGTRWYP